MRGQTGVGLGWLEEVALYVRSRINDFALQPAALFSCAFAVMNVELKSLLAAETWISIHGFVYEKPCSQTNSAIEMAAAKYDRREYNHFTKMFTA